MARIHDIIFTFQKLSLNGKKKNLIKKLQKISIKDPNLNPTTKNINHNSIAKTAKPKSQWKTFGKTPNKRPIIQLQINTKQKITMKYWN